LNGLTGYRTFRTALAAARWIFFSALTIACLRPAEATIYLVTANPDLTFTPASLTIYQGDSVVFKNAGGLHNVVADDNRFKCAVNCTSQNAPSAQLWSATIHFTRLGDLGYYCEQHGNTMIGMRGMISTIDRVFVDGFESTTDRTEILETSGPILEDGG
jgi:plastocyanin